MTVIINERRITDDSPDIKITELDMSLCESVNIDGNASLSAITISVFDTKSVLHFMTDYYDYKPVRILDELTNRFLTVSSLKAKPTENSSN